MEFTHERFGKCVLVDISQKLFEDYSQELLDKGDVTVIQYRGLSVKAAIKLGILIEPEMTPEDVDNASPGLIRWLSDICIAKHIQEANSVDPLS